MKLIFCGFCQDIVKLLYDERKCHCGRSSGKYLKDGLHAEIKGAAIPLGFSNSTFIQALRNRPQKGMGSNFTAFVIPESCPTIKNLKK